MIRIYSPFDDPRDYESLEASASDWEDVERRIARRRDDVCALRARVRADGSLVLPGDADYSPLVK